MIIEVLNQKYKCGCNRGANKFERSNILSDLNSVIDWEKSSFPEDKNGNEKRDYLGTTPELKPGNCFLFDGQVIAVDSEDKLVLIISETGSYGSLKRIVSDYLDTEINLKKVREEVIFYDSQVKYTEIDKDSVDRDKFSVQWPVPYPQFKLWADNYRIGREFLLCSYRDFDFIEEDIEFIIRDWDILFKGEDVDDKEDEALLNSIVERTFAWFFENVAPVKRPEEGETTENPTV